MAINRLQVIDPKSVSFEDILNDLNTFIQSKEAENNWTSFLSSGPGQTLAELMAGVGHLLNFHSISLKRETGLQTTQNYNSAANLALNLDYPINRISAPRIILELLIFNPSLTDSITLDRNTPIATIDGRNISLLDTLTINTGLNDFSGEYAIECAVGDWEVYTTTIAQDQDFGRLLIQDTGIDNDTLSRVTRTGLSSEFPVVDNITNQLFINKVDFPSPDDHTMVLVRFAESLLDTDALMTKKVIVKTHSEGVLLLFGNGIVGRKLYQGDEIEFHYIKSDAGPLNRVTIAPTDINFINIPIDNPSDNITFVDDPTLANPGYVQDSIQQIKNVASGYYAAKRRMVTEEDHEYIARSFPGIISAKVEVCKDKVLDIEGVKILDENNDEVTQGTWTVVWDSLDPVYVPCCGIKFSYLFSDEHKMNENEIEDFNAYLDQFRLLGQTFEFVDPKKIGVIFNLTIVIGENANESEIQAQIAEIAEDQMLQLKGVLRPGVIYRDVSRIVGVDRVYPESPISDRETLYDEYYRLEGINLNIVTNPLQVITSDANDDSYIFLFEGGETYPYNKLIYAPGTLTEGLTNPNEHIIATSRLGQGARVIRGNGLNPNTSPYDNNIFDEAYFDFSDLETWKPVTAYASGTRVYAPFGSSIAGKVIQCAFTHVSTTNFTTDYAQSGPALWTGIEVGT